MSDAEAIANMDMSEEDAVKLLIGSSAQINRSADAPESRREQFAEMLEEMAKRVREEEVDPRVLVIGIEGLRKETKEVDVMMQTAAFCPPPIYNVAIIDTLLWISRAVAEREMEGYQSRTAMLERILRKQAGMGNDS